MASFPRAGGGNRAGIKGYDRFIDQPDRTVVTLSATLAPHRACTLERMRAEPVVLCIKDGTDLNCASHPDADILVSGSKTRRAVAVDASVTTGPAEPVLKTVQAGSVAGTMIIAVDRLTPRSKRSNRPAKTGCAARSATLVVRGQMVERAPTSREHPGESPTRLQAVMVEKERAPANATPIRWSLFTTLPADILEDCGTAVGYQVWRLRIEDWHQILKYRGLAPDPEVRMRGPGAREPLGPPPRPGRRHQPGHRMAHLPGDAARPRSP
ncbi:MAG: hypothetical protein OXE86_11850 [Alphaproteobacteria bacterium]|nr:hypothetical protein [Alphaproteobacteria bacterium]